MTKHQERVTKIAQLLALAKSTSFPPERESARSKASILMQKWGISMLEVSAFMQSLLPKRPQPRPVRRTVQVFHGGWDISIEFGSNVHWETRSFSSASNITSGTY